MTETQTISAERNDILSLLAERRHFLRFTAQGLTDEQANTRSTVSELTVGGLIKHVTEV
ncbi:mycothiol transferase, partial [Mycobacterium kansasii]